MTKDEIAALDKALDMRLETIPRKLKFSIRTTEMDQTFEVRKQNTLTLWQILGTFWEKTIPLLMQMNNPQIPEPVKMAMTKAFTGGARLMEQTFKFFGEDDTTKFVPNYEKLEILSEIKEAMQGDVSQLKQMLEVVKNGKSIAGGGLSGGDTGNQGQGVPGQNQAGIGGFNQTSGMAAPIPNPEQPIRSTGALA